MKFKISIFLTVLLIFICCIGAASAVEDINDDVTSTDSDLDVIEQSDDVDLQADTSEDTTLEVNNDENDNLRATSVTVNTWSQLAGNASSSGDKTINLASGTTFTPTSQIVFGNSATIVGTPTSYISGTYSGIPFVNSNRANSITFQNVNFKDMTCQMLMQMQTNGITILDGCTFTNIQTGTGHDSVIYNNWGTMNVTDCTFTNCKTGFGVITNYHWSSQTGIILNVKNCKFENNTASSEPGAINNCAVLTVYNCTFIKNNSTMWAGAIHTHSKANTIINKSIFKGNFAEQNGGALFTYSVLEIYNSIFEDNVCNDTTGGGAIGSYNYGSNYDIWIENCTFKNNRNNATGGHGGAITALNNGYLNVFDSTFIANYADVGQAICAYNQHYENGTGGKPYLRIEDCTFENHTGSSDTVYITGTVNSFKYNTFINSPQTPISGSGNSYNFIVVPMNINTRELLGSSPTDLLSDNKNHMLIYVNISSTNDGSRRTGKPGAVDGQSWEQAYGLEDGFKEAIIGIINDDEQLILGQIILADGEYSIWNWEDYYAKYCRVIGDGNQVVFKSDNCYNLDFGSQSDYADSVTNFIRNTAAVLFVHENIIFDCDVKVGSKNFKFINCTFKKGLTISHDYQYHNEFTPGATEQFSDIFDITFEGCTFENPKSDINIVEEKNNVVFDNNCKFPVTAIDSNITISSIEKNIVIIDLKDVNGNAIGGATVKYSINNGEELFNITDSNGQIKISGLTGLVNIFANYTGNESYNANTSSASFDFKLNSKITITNESKVIIITLADENGEAIVGASVKYTINNGEELSNTTDSNGQIKISSVPDEFDIEVNYLGDDTFNGNVTSQKFNFTQTTAGTNGTSTNSTGNATSGNGTSTNTGKTTTNTQKVTKKATKITAKKATFKAKKKTKKYTIVLKAGKAAVKKVKVTLKVGKKTYKATTNKKGKATFKITKLNKKGKYTAVIKFKGNKNFKATSKKVKITVKK